MFLISYLYSSFTNVMPPSTPNPVFCSSGLNLSNVDTYFAGSGIIGPSLLTESTQSSDNIVGGAACADSAAVDVYLAMSSCDNNPNGPDL